MASKIEVTIVGDASKLSSAFKQAGASADAFGSSVGGKLSSGLVAVGKAAIVAGAALGAGFAVTLKVGARSLIEHEKALAQTMAALKSTGGAAGVTAKDIVALSNSIEKMSGVDDLAVQGAENLLLTFKNVKNEVGAGSNVFDRATMAITDMSVAMGQDMSSSAIQLGKALNDPINGLTALQRVGVQFTDAQKDQIKAMVEAGDVMGAQKLILAELESQFGGSAAALGDTFAGKVEILKARFEELAESIASRVMPYADRFVAFLSDVASSNSFGEALGKIGDGLAAMFDGIRDAASKVDWSAVANTIGKAISRAVKAFPWKDTFSFVGQLFADIAQGIDEAFGSPIQRTMRDIAESVLDFLARMVDGWAKVVEIAADVDDLWGVLGESPLHDAAEDVRGWADALRDSADAAHNWLTPAEKLHAQQEELAKAAARQKGAWDDLVVALRSNNPFGKLAASDLPALATALVNTTSKIKLTDAATLVLIASLGRVPSKVETQALLNDPEAKAKLVAWVNQINGVPATKETKAEMLSEGAESNARQLKNAIENIPKAWHTTASNNANAAKGQIDALGRAIRNLPRSQTFTLYVQQVGSLNIPHSPGSATVFGGLASGGVVRNPFTLVGERGPEIVSLPQGSHVYSHRQSQAIMGGAAGGGDVHVTVNVAGPVTGAQDLAKLVRDELVGLSALTPSLWRGRA
jgi:hypothetical protein